LTTSEPAQNSSKSVSRVGASRSISILCFVGLFLLGFAARYHDVAAKPFWMDEVTTIHRARLPLWQMIQNSVFFHQFPSYFILTSWALHFGHDELWVRMPAIICGALSCALAFGVARALGGTLAGLAAGLLMVFSPEQVQYGQEARSYTLLISTILIALWGLVLLAQDPEGAAKRLRDPGGRPGAWVAYVFGTIAALNVLSVSMFWFVAANLAAFAIAWRRGSRPRGFWRNWARAQLVIVIFCLPWFLALKFFGQRGALGGLDWVPPLDGARIWWTLAGTYFMHVTSLIAVRVFANDIPGLGLLVLLLAAGGAYALRRQRAALTVLTAAILVLPLCLLAISAFSPVWMPRYTLWSAAPFFICAGLSITLLPRRLQAPAVAVLGLLAAANLRPYYHDETKPRWDLAAADLHADLQPGDLLLVDDPGAVHMMNLYLRRQGAHLPQTAWTQDVQQAAAARAAGRRVWAVQGRVGQADHENRAQFLTSIASLGPPNATEHVGLDILLMRFDGETHEASN
jgi:mannosyltransferase